MAWPSPMPSPPALPETIDAYHWRPGVVLAMLIGQFVFLGLTVGVQGVLWAELVSVWQISMGVFGTAQLVAPLISVVLLVVGGTIVGRAGTRLLALSSLVLLGLSAVALGGVTNLWGLIVALVLLGAGNGLFELGMNGATLDWEQATGRAAINLMHAGFSAGAVVGALGAGLLLGGGWRAGQILLLLAVSAGLLLLVSVPVRYPPAAGATSATAGAAPATAGATTATAGATERAPGAGTTGLGATLQLFRQRRPLVALAVIGMLGAVGEIVANLWSVIYLQGLGANAVVGGVTFSLLNGAMLIGRLINAPLIARHGARLSLQLSGLGLFVTTLLLFLPGGLPLAIAAFILLGLAVAGVVPTVLGEGARQAPGNSGAIAGGMLAAVYLSFMVSPPLIGWLADLFSLQAALAILGLSGLAIVWLISTSPPSSG